MAKKATKQGAKKKKKAAKKTATRGRAVRKRAPARRARKADVTIRFRCAGAAGCLATPASAHMSPGDTVALVAVNTDAKITFAAATGSPFVGGANPITIAEGNTSYKTVKATAAGVYPYRLTCSKCAKRPLAPPEMIVP